MHTSLAIKLIGITHIKFLVTFPTEEDRRETQERVLRTWFKETKKAIHLDMVPPRIAWVYCNGLPYSLWNLENWKKIMGDWGQILTRKFKIFNCGMIQTPRICIQTYQVRDIDETVKVLVDSKGYWVKIRESKVCVDTAEMIMQHGRKTSYDAEKNSFSVESDMENGYSSDSDQETAGRFAKTQYHNVTNLTEQEDKEVEDWANNGDVQIPNELISEALKWKEQDGASTKPTPHSPARDNLALKDKLTEITEDLEDLVEEDDNTTEKRLWDDDHQSSQIWSMRKNNDSSSDSNTQSFAEESEKFSELPTIVEVDEEERSVDQELTKQLTKIGLGKKTGRPRKLPKINLFFTTLVEQRSRVKWGKKQGD